jgi:hypothetical protein
MAGKPAEPPDLGQRPAAATPLAAGASDGPPADQREHTGPVTFKRYVKDDGRALILYCEQRRAEDPPREA